MLLSECTAAQAFSSPPPMSAEPALMSMAVLLAPDEDWALSLLGLVSDSLLDPGRVRRDYHDWLDDPSWSKAELARQALLTGLTGSLWGLDPVLVGFDWRASAEEMHNSLRRIPLSPLAAWDPESTVRYTRSDPDAAAPYLREAARRSREAGMALFRIHIGDSFELGFVRADRGELLLTDAARAGYTAATDHVFELVDG
ncbi:hypothetical protein [Nocardia sp. NPDC127526]|uniref:DUF6630 family protein n=1 Tax=Nocardia sp. NPDC127526 TaxID=3345393 RepID=UPI00363080FD